MPTDINGNYSLPAGYLAITGQTIQPSQHNPPLEDIATGLSARLPINGAKAMTGPVKASDGAVGAPSYAFGTALTTGFYKTTGGIGVSIAGTLVAEFGAGGLSKGARLIGELIPWTGTSAPALCVLPVGQALSRTTYADLWAFAQTEIAAGNTLFTNGDGSTTFTVPDLRGRALVTKDTSGSVVTSFSMSPDGNTLGAKGGGQASQLSTANLPPYTPAGIINTSVSNGSFFAGSSAGTVAAGAGTTVPLGNSAINVGVSAGFVGSAQGGTSTLFTNMQPSILVNYALFAGA